MLTRNRMLKYRTALFFVIIGYYCRSCTAQGDIIRPFYHDFDCAAANGRMFTRFYNGMYDFPFCSYCNPNRVWIHNQYNCRDCTSAEFYQTGECLLRPTTCPTGQFLSGNSCQLCPVDTFKTGTNINNCSPCPANSNGPQGSGSPDNCVCQTGFTGSNGEACIKIVHTSCPTGLFLQDNACSVCLPNTYKAETGSQLCTPCPNNSDAPEGSGHVTECICNAKAVRPKADEGCVTCQTGYFKSSSSVCSVCGPLRTAFQEDLDTCLCIAGYGENSNGICQLCPRNTYTNVAQGDVRMIQKCIVRPKCIHKKKARAN